MKLVTFSHLHRTAPDRVEGQDTHVGIYLPGDMPRVLNLEAAHEWLNKKKGGTSDLHPPMTMLELLDGGQAAMERVQKLAETVCEDEEGLWGASQSIDDVTLLSPVPFPRTIRDFYAFEQHVKTARALRGLEMIPEWYDHPVFYYSNPGCVYGPYDDIDFPHASHEVDFELEIACVIGKPGKDIPADKANEYIAGYLIMNDWSARDTWRNFEAKLSMGPAKSKDFATTLGPWLVTPDELESRRQGDAENTRHNLEMVARVNGKELSRGNADTLTHTFAQMIEWASTDVWLRPGDVLGSGTVGTGCILELRPENTGGWLKPGDVVEMEIEKLGAIKNKLIG